jgi:uncharacterized protein (TIGR03790 family)
MKPWLRLCLLVAPLGLAAAEPDPAAHLVLLANSRQPESVALAHFYAQQRGVPETNIIALPMPEEEGVTWRQFIDQVYQPLQDELYRRDLIEGTASTLVDRYGRKRYAFTAHHLSYLVTCRGVPLRIYNDPTTLTEKTRLIAPLVKNEAAVDSELSLLAWGTYDPTGPLSNPLFGRDGPATLDALQIVKVCRLDGPTWESARHLVTAALAAERNGPKGRYYVDLGGPHAEGDQWLRQTLAQLRELGLDGEVDEGPETFGADARFDAPVLYFGWYAPDLDGPFARPGFAFPDGAIAEHIHSYSAQTLHSETAGWCGPLLARGVTATVGNVFEPDLKFVHRPNLLLRALARGQNFGDAVYYALPALSWQEVAIGDPLYQPFAKKAPR